eukprot:6136542-Pleurochrysis_carterae.AAC.1
MAFPLLTDARLNSTDNRTPLLGEVGRKRVLPVALCARFRTCVSVGAARVPKKPPRTKRLIACLSGSNARVKNELGGAQSGLFEKMCAPKCVRMCVRARGHARASVRACAPAGVRASERACVRACVHACLRASVRGC